MGDSEAHREAGERGSMWKVHVGQVLVQVGYGASYALSKSALATGVNPIVFAVYRDVVCMLVLVPLAFIFDRKKQVPLTKELLGLLFAFGFFGSFATQIVMLYGLAMTSAAYASTISVLTPLFTFIISTSSGFERIRWRRRDGQLKVAGLVSSVIGAAVLALYFGPVVLGPTDLGQETPLSQVDPFMIEAHTSKYLHTGSWRLGIFLLFLAGFTLSVCISIQVPILERYPAPISVCCIAYFLGASMLSLAAIATVEDSSAWVVTDRTAIISYIYNGLIPAAFNFTILVWSVQKAGPVLVGSYIPLQLFSAALFAYIFLNESIHLGSVLGTVMIISGLGLITRGKIESHNLYETGSLLDNNPVIIATSGVAPGLAEPLLG